MKKTIPEFGTVITFLGLGCLITIKLNLIVPIAGDYWTAFFFTLISMSFGFILFQMFKGVMIEAGSFLEKGRKEETPITKVNGSKDK